MKTRSLCITLLIAIAMTLVESKAPEVPRGVSPSKAKAYSADQAGNWKCLDGSKTIKFSAVNDDYCDCPDGSDEPGTSACGQGYFFCPNKGHTAAYIKTSRINDGVCDQECCDGSDETDGQIQCPNTCQHVGAQAKQERERLRVIEEAGGKLRRSYINYGKKTKKELQTKLERLQREQSAIQNTAAQTKNALDRINAVLEEQRESTKVEREAARKLQLAPLILQQNERLVYARSVLDKLIQACDDLKINSNKNYHDLAVKSAITEYEEWLEEYKKKIESAKGFDTTKDRTADEIMRNAVDETYEVRKEIGALYILLKGMKNGYNTDNNDIAVLRVVKAFDEFTPTWKGDHDDFVNGEPLEIPPENKVENAPQPRTGALASVIAHIRRGARTVGLKFLAPDTRSEKQIVEDAHKQASAKERSIESEVQEVERKLNMDYGSDERFAKLVDQCFEFKEIETFSGWIGDNYDTQLYSGGLKCWNGPDRSVKVVMSCGEQNEIIAVSEPEKCEYLFKFRTPAACRLLDGLDASEDNMEPTMPGEAKRRVEL
ncbi:hypothetical protein BG004_003236 [Podila humilis]|nr:hypothetical protein BG004_003236 [Podila humilis]